MMRGVHGVSTLLGRGLLREMSDVDVWSLKEDFWIMCFVCLEDDEDEMKLARCSKQPRLYMKEWVMSVEKYYLSSRGFSILVFRLVLSCLATD